MTTLCLRFDSLFTIYHHCLFTIRHVAAQPWRIYEMYISRIDQLLGLYYIYCGRTLEKQRLHLSPQPFRWRARNYVLADNGRVWRKRMARVLHCGSVECWTAAVSSAELRQCWVLTWCAYTVEHTVLVFSSTCLGERVGQCCRRTCTYSIQHSVVNRF